MSCEKCTLIVEVAHTRRPILSATVTERYSYGRITGRVRLRVLIGGAGDKMELVMKLTRRQCMTVLGSAVACSASTSPEVQWQKAAAATDGVVGAAAMHLSSGERFSLNGDE